MGIFIKNIDNLINKLKETNKNIIEQTSQMLETAGLIVEKRAKENITGLYGHDKHIDTGSLRASIRTFTVDSSKYTPKVAIGTGVYYAWYVERLPLGSRRKTPIAKNKSKITNLETGVLGVGDAKYNPGGYLFPAFKEVHTDVLEYIKEHLVKIIGK